MTANEWLQALSTSREDLHQQLLSQFQQLNSDMSPLLEKLGQLMS